MDKIVTHKAGETPASKKAPRQRRKTPPKVDELPKADKPPVDKEPETKKDPVPAQPTQYVVTRSGMGSYNGGVHTFKAGEVISDPWIINQLKAANADFIEPVGADTIIRTCPHCKEKLVLHASDLTAKK